MRQSGSTLEAWQHEHLFLGAHHLRNERRTWFVIALTAVTMLVEIAAGALFGSMALIADGWHMATHAAALTISAAAYSYARRHAHDPRFAFGTGKFGDLAGFTSAVVLALISLLIGWESLLRLTSPIPIRFEEAIAVAVLGLAVNLASAWLLREEHDPAHHAHRPGHAHGHSHGRAHGHAHAPGHAHAYRHDHGHGDGHDAPSRGQAHARDHNLRAAYLHVLADALTSVLAIVALLTGRLYGWIWLDPAIGLVGALVIARWAWSLMRDAGAVLLDAVPDPELAHAVRQALEVGGDRVSDLHLWQIGPGHRAAIVSIVSPTPCPARDYKARLAHLPGISHLTVEVHERDRSDATTDQRR